MTNLEINNLTSKLESVKFKLFEALAEIDNLENVIKEMNSKRKNSEEIENIPRSNFTTISKKEAFEKKEEDQTETSKIIIDDDISEDTEIILLATDGSYVKNKSRISTACSIVFAENSILNEDLVTTAIKSSTEPEIIGILNAVLKCAKLNLKNVVVSSDSTGAIGFLVETSNNEVKTKNYKAHLNNRQIAKLTDTTEKVLSTFKFLAALYTPAHKFSHDIWTTLNNKADSRS